MSRKPCTRHGLAGILFALLGRAGAQFDTNENIPDVAPANDFFQFVTRPDIRAPRYDVTFYDRSLVSDGYWFISTYEQIGLDPPSNPLWVGPQIYDNNGELVWSSSDKFENANTFDFKRTKVNGKDRLLFTDPYAESAIIMDEHFEVERELDLGNRGNIDMHEFNMVANGTIALIARSNTTRASIAASQAIGYDGHCQVLSHGWEAKDATTPNWDSIMSWEVLDHIRLEESTMGPSDVDKRCSHWWDFVHTNSIDLCPDGNFVLSARHTDAIYKISRADGSIMWRLGGKFSNFEGDFKFSRQHHIRCHEQNQTHTIVSMLDNAKGQDPQAATHPYSRGLIIALETPRNWTGQSNKTMKMEIVAQFDHPERKYNTGRGDCELLDNGNVFMGWSNQGLHSEHTSDGKMIMKAKLVTDWLRTYRTFKSPLVGRPKHKPTVVSVASNAPNVSTTTRVYVSWNGATEVSHWNLYKSNEDEQHTLLVVSASRLGFETEMVYEGFASHIIVEAVDTHGMPLANGRSSVIKTIPPPYMNDSAVTEESKWLEEAAYDKHHPWIAKVKESRESPWAMFVAGLLVSAGVILGVMFGRRLIAHKPSWWRQSPSYEPLADEEREAEASREFELDDMDEKHANDSKDAAELFVSVESLTGSSRS